MGHRTDARPLSSEVRQSLQLLLASALVIGACLGTALAAVRVLG
jgi:hypothetical protein